MIVYNFILIVITLIQQKHGIVITFVIKSKRVVHVGMISDNITFAHLLDLSLLITDLTISMNGTYSEYFPVKF